MRAAISSGVGWASSARATLPAIDAAANAVRTIAPSARSLPPCLRRAVRGSRVCGSAEEIVDVATVKPPVRAFVPSHHEPNATAFDRGNVGRLSGELHAGHVESHKDHAKSSGPMSKKPNRNAAKTRRQRWRNREKKLSCRSSIAKRCFFDLV
ncbi:MAG TPA: hypothetical protein VK509_06345, partial [Polyangiales bacterium]|nr:hypothetical protein [Polyangiales bacterium]